MLHFRCQIKNRSEFTLSRVTGYTDEDFGSSEGKTGRRAVIFSTTRLLSMKGLADIAKSARSVFVCLFHRVWL